MSAGHAGLDPAEGRYDPVQSFALARLRRGVFWLLSVLPVSVCARQDGREILPILLVVVVFVGKLDEALPVLNTDSQTQVYYL